MCYKLLYFQTVSWSWYVVPTPEMMDVAYNRLKNKVDLLDLNILFLPRSKRTRSRL